MKPTPLVVAACLALSACQTTGTTAAPPVTAAASPPTTLDPAAPDAMRWLYGSGEAAGVSLQAWRQLADYAIAQSRLKRVPQSAPMGIAGGIARPSCMADDRIKPLAVVFDVDETVILNEGFEFHAAFGNPYTREDWAEWEREGAAHVTAVPGAVAGLRRLREAGITPVFNTNRQVSPEGAARALAAAGLGEAIHKRTLFLSGDDGGSGSGKDGRRAMIAQSFCVIALAGDNLGDFADLLNAPDLGPLARRALAGEGEYGEFWGRGWFALPNPVYGHAIKGTVGEIFPPAVRWHPDGTVNETK